jgi:MoaA/NifB/PqqE/SkfB family radical SAM enzyme
MEELTKVFNPFIPLYQKINTTPDHLKYANLPEWPLMIDVELTNKCNMKCMFCFNSMQSREIGFMSEETYLSMLEEVMPGKIPLRFIRWGENLIHKDATRYMRMAKERGLLVHLTTNGSILTEGIIKELIDMKLDSIKISFQGANEKNYEAMRNNKMYQKVIRNLQKLWEMRGGGHHPHIQISSTMTDETENEIEEFKRFVSPMVDAIAIGKTNLSRVDPDRMKFSDEEKNKFNNLKSREKLVKQYKECVEVFDKLSINWDGTVSACCGDYDNILLVGDIKTQKLKDIWTGKPMDEIRNILLRHEHVKLNLCRNCYYPLKVGRIAEQAS